MKRALLLSALLCAACGAPTPPDVPVTDAAAPRAIATAAVGATAAASSVGDAPRPPPPASAGVAAPLDKPTSYDVRATLEKAGYSRIVATAFGDTFRIDDAAGPDKLTASVDVNDTPTELKGGVAKAVGYGLTITVLVKRGGAKDAAASAALLEAVVAGIGRTPRPVYVAPRRPLAWHITDLGSPAKLRPLLTRAGFADEGESEQTNPEPGSFSANANGTKDGVWVTLRASCYPGFSAPTLAKMGVGEAVYFEGHCELVVIARTKDNRGAPVPEAAQKLLAAVLDEKP